MCVQKRQKHIRSHNDDNDLNKMSKKTILMSSSSLCVCVFGTNKCYGVQFVIVVVVAGVVAGVDAALCYRPNHFDILYI